jgi:hypothetical protein
MKIVAELDDVKLELARSLGGIESVSNLLDLALDAYIAKGKRNNLSNILGTNSFEEDLSDSKDK